VSGDPWTREAAWHRPRFYRYRLADPGLRVALNRYGTLVIGIAFVIGRHAWCVKWAKAKLLPPRSWGMTP
jgi:hypothetical protein